MGIYSRKFLIRIFRTAFGLLVACTCFIALQLSLVSQQVTNTIEFSMEDYYFDDTSGKQCDVYTGNYTQRAPVDLRVIIITYDRPRSLFRLLLSLNSAFYDGDNVAIDIWVDRPRSGNVSRETLERARMFRFERGECNIHVHKKHVGIRGQWLDTWDPPLNYPEIAVILEDDLTVSPYFYKYLKLVHSKYSDHSDIAGFTLQGKTVLHGPGVRTRCCVNLEHKHKVFLYPTLGTSGFSPNRLKWIEFKEWLKETLAKKLKLPLVPNHVASEWFTTLSEKGDHDSMWEMEYLYYTWRNTQYCLYPNFKGHKGLVYNWFENGLHYTGSAIRNKNEAERNLVMKWTSSYDQLPDFPVHLNNDGDIRL